MFIYLYVNVDSQKKHLLFPFAKMWFTFDSPHSHYLHSQYVFSAARSLKIKPMKTKDVEKWSKAVVWYQGNFVYLEILYIIYISNYCYTASIADEKLSVMDEIMLSIHFTFCYNYNFLSHSDWLNKITAFSVVDFF